MREALRGPGVAGGGAPRCAGADAAALPAAEAAELRERLRGDGHVNPFVQPGNLTRVLAVASGKGGVGKSSVTANLAASLQARGLSVGILDADVTGPSIPKTFGINAPLTADADGVVPASTASGIKIMSTNLMLPKDDIPVAWRGPVVSGIIKQFWGEVSWGDIDYLFVDMPP